MMNRGSGRFLPIAPLKRSEKSHAHRKRSPLFNLMTRITKRMSSVVTKKDQDSKTQDSKTQDTKTQDTKTQDQDTKTQDQDQDPKTQDQDPKTQDTKTQDQDTKTQDPKTQDQDTKTQDKRKPKRWLSQEALPTRHHHG
jgi:hypothetical protein